MQIVVFNHQLTSSKPQNKRRKPRRDGIHAQPGVPHDLREQDERLANPPVVERHRQPQAELDRAVSRHRHDEGFDQFLLDVGETRQHRDGVLGGVVRFVEFPQRADFVAGAVVGVEPEVEDDGVEEEFEGQPAGYACGGEGPVVEVAGYEDEGEGPEEGEEGYAEEGFGEARGGDLVAGVVVGVEEADSVGERG